MVNFLLQTGRTCCILRLIYLLLLQIYYNLRHSVALNQFLSILQRNLKSSQLRKQALQESLSIQFCLSCPLNTQLSLLVTHFFKKANFLISIILWLVEFLWRHMTSLFDNLGLDWIGRFNSIILIYCSLLYYLVIIILFSFLGLVV